MWTYIIQGFLLGMAYVAPIGTQNLFVINTALTQKRKRVLLTALIVCFFDVSLSVGCFFGIGALMEQSIWIELFVVLIGSLVVIWIGIGIFRSHDTMDTSVNTDLPVGKIIWTACVVTWFNPQALIDGTMLLGASRAAVPHEFQTPFILACAMASVVWWFGMSSIVNALSSKINDKTLRIVNIICGLFIIFYGGKLLYSGINIAIDYFG